MTDRYMHSDQADIHDAVGSWELGAKDRLLNVWVMIDNHSF